MTLPRGERGETLLELLITITIMGGVIVAIVAGIAFAADSSDRNKKEIGVEYVLRDYAEAVKASNYNGCAVPNNIRYTPPTGYAVSTPVVTGCYDGTSTSFGTGGTTANTAVRLQLEAHTTDSSTLHGRSKSLEVVKARDYERPS